MKTGNVVLDKSYAFAVRIVQLHQFLVQEKQALQLADQILRSGTAIGANVEEAVGGFSKQEFVAKCSIAYKEALETHFWLRLLRDTHYLDEPLATSLLAETEELKKLLASIIISSRNADNASSSKS